MSHLLTIENFTRGFLIGKAARTLFHYNGSRQKCPLPNTVTVVDNHVEKAHLYITPCMNKVYHTGHHVVNVEMDKLAYDIVSQKFYVYRQHERIAHDEQEERVKIYVDLCPDSEFHENCINKYCPVTDGQLKRFPKTIERYLEEGWTVIKDDIIIPSHTKLPTRYRQEVTFSYHLQVRSGEKKVIFSDEYASQEKFTKVLDTLEMFIGNHDTISIRYLYLNTNAEWIKVVLPSNTLVYLREVVKCTKEIY